MNLSIGENQEKKLAEKSKDSPQKVNVDLTLLPLKEQNPGIIAWAKIAGHNWWPGNILSILFFLYILFPYKRYTSSFFPLYRSISQVLARALEWRMRRFDRSIRERSRTIDLDWEKSIRKRKKRMKTQATPFVIRSDDYRLSRLLHARTNVRLPMDNVVRRLQTVRGKNYPTYIFKITCLDPETEMIVRSFSLCIHGSRCIINYF